MVLLIGWSATASAQYNPTNPAEPGVPNPVIRRTLTTRCVPEGAGSITSSGDYVVGNTVSMSAYANSGFQFIQWEDEEGNVISTSSYFELTMPAHDETLIARFLYSPSSPSEPGVPDIRPTAKVFLQSVPDNACSFNYTSGQKHEIGTTQIFTANPRTNYEFVSWTKDGVVISESQSLDYEIEKGEQTLVANLRYNFDPESPGEPSSPTLPEDETGVTSGPRIMMYDNTHIQILCQTRGATIYYTLDGSTPTEESEIYTGPVFVDSNVQVKAFASKEGLENSSITSYQVTAYTVDTPTFNFVNKNIEISCSTPDATIYYTVDYSDPDTSSTVYTSPIDPVENFVIKAYAVKDGFTDSKVRVFIYFRKDFTISSPTFSLNDLGQLVITPAMSDCNTYYTTDGTDPTTASTLYTEPITLDSNCTIKAYSTNDVYFDSEISAYEVTGFKLPTPSAVFDNLRLTLSCTDPQARILYTLSSDLTNVEFTAYETPLELTADCTVSFYAVRDNYDDSEMATYVFKKADHTVADPAISYDAETATVTITSATEGASIRYTLDGTVPTDTTGTAYTAAFTVAGNRTVTAAAFKEKFFNSESASYVISGQKTPTPTAVYDSLQLTLSCPDPEATVYYTTAADLSGAEFKAYESPLALTEDCTVSFYAAREYFDNSETGTFSFVKATYTVAKPVISHNAETDTVTITTPTEGATIRYTLDGTTPTATTGTVYSEPFEVSGNVTVTAVAFLEKHFDSEATILVIEEMQAPTPTAVFEGLRLTLSCADTEAKIFYTTDDTVASSDFIAYENPIELTADCTVRFYASREHYKDSEIGSFSFVKATYTVAKPEIGYDTTTDTVTITTATEGATIRYTLNGTVPTDTTGTAYTAPFRVEGNFTVTAVAFKENLFGSEPTVYIINTEQVATPTAIFGNRQLTLNCTDSVAQIRYSIDANAATSQFAVYSSPIALSRDCTVRFYATRANFNDSQMGSFTFRKADHQEAAPAITEDFNGRKVTVSHSASARVSVSIDGRAAEYATPVTLDVTSADKRLSVHALAANGDRYDSDTIAKNLVFHPVPALTFNGHTVDISLAGDPNAAGARILSYLNDRSMGDGAASVAIDNFGTFRAHVESDHAFRSDESQIAIDFYNTGRVAGARNGHRLEEAFNKWESEYGYPELTLVGELAKADLEFAAQISGLETLHLNHEASAEEALDAVLSGSNVKTISLDTIPEGLLKDMPLLTSVIWRNTSAVAPLASDILGANPNMLIWVADKNLAPEGAVNIITFDSTHDVMSSGYEGHADHIVLTPGFPFNPHMPVDVDFIEFTKEFNQSTEKDVCRGWETIVLPFTPEAIRHSEKGEIIPYTEWERRYESGEFGDEGPKPFWLYNSTSDDWAPSSTLEAGTPYIISMPNNPDYIESYNLAGKITFSAADVRIGDEGTFPARTSWIDGMYFSGTYMPVEEENHLSLNNEWQDAADGVLPGSMFTQDAETTPFEAYITGNGAARNIPVFTKSTGVYIPTIQRGERIKVEIVGKGMIRVTSAADTTADIYTTTGLRLRSISLRAGTPVVVDDLAPGIYIVAGHKISL